MFERTTTRLLFLALALAVGACSNGTGEGPANANSQTQSAESPKPRATPSRNITEADVAKLKWLEGNWRGMDGQKPFYQRIRFEASSMIVETLADEAGSRVTDTRRFELKDGEFGLDVGQNRTAASVIDDNSVHFVTAGPQGGADIKGGNFRFEKLSEGTWQAVLETQSTPGRAVTEKAYKMEPLKPQAK